MADDKKPEPSNDPEFLQVLKDSLARIVKHIDDRELWRADRIYLQMKRGLNTIIKEIEKTMPGDDDDG